MNPLFFFSFVVVEDVPLVEFMYLIFIRMPDESYRRRLRSLVCLCDVFRTLANSHVCLLFLIVPLSNLGHTQVGQVWRIGTHQGSTDVFD